MWGEIILSVATSVGEAICVNRINNIKNQKLCRELNIIVKDEFNDFADTSLDCKAFYQLVKSSAFTNVLRNLFCSIHDNLSIDNHTKAIESYICAQCPSVNPIEAKRFVQAIEKTYALHLKSIISSNSELSAVFQAMTYSNRYLVEQINESENNIKKYIDSLLNKNKKISDERISEYHRVCENNCNTISFAGIAGVESKRPQDINKYYVENTFSDYYPTGLDTYNYDADQINTIKLKDFFEINNKIVLVGAAGLGKSTTLNYLFCNYEKMYKAYPLKIKIDLKNYANDISENNKDLLWCIATDFRKKTKRINANFDELEESLAIYLDSGRCLLILDALDEITTLSAREKVRTEIANFCEIYYLNRIIVSTREVGYLKNCFDNSFFHIRINNFNAEQIKSYSKNWFHYIHQKSDTEGFWNKFKREVKRANCISLIRNPIVLVLALNIFDVEKCLPNKRIEFYKKCVETFLSLREDRKKAFELSDNAKNILNSNSVIPGIANYLYSHTKDNSKYKFNSEELRQSVYVALEIEDELIWGIAVKEYLEYLINRTELISEKNEDEYAFAHKTFFEYFLAIYFVNEYQVDQLIEVLDEWIGDSNYDELARLIIEVVIQKDDHLQHDKVIEYLLNNVFVNGDYSNINFDMLAIILNLFTLGLLKPKYHSRYFEIYLAEPQILDLMPFRHLFAKNPDVSIYDARALAVLFSKEFNSENMTERTVKALAFLNDDFRKNVVDELNNKKITYIVQLFEYVLDKECTHSIETADINAILDYFLGEGLDLVLDYALIFLSVVYLASFVNKNEKICSLFNYRFHSSDYFLCFFGPREFDDFLYKTSIDKEYFLLTLIAIIDCCSSPYLGKFNTILIELIHGSKGNIPKLADAIIDCLLFCKEYKERILSLKTYELYIPEYEQLYKNLFDNFDSKISEQEKKEIIDNMKLKKKC